MFPVLRVVDEQFSAHTCASYLSFVQSPAMSCAARPICRIVSFFPTFCFSMSNNAVNLVSNWLTMQRYNRFRCGEWTFFVLSEKPSDISAIVRKTVRHRPFGFENALKSQRNSPDSPWCDITYTYNLHVSEINMSVRPLHTDGGEVDVIHLI